MRTLASNLTGAGRILNDAAPPGRMPVAHWSGPMLPDPRTLAVYVLAGLLVVSLSTACVERTGKLQAQKNLSDERRARGGDDRARAHRAHRHRAQSRDRAGAAGRSQRA